MRLRTSARMIARSVALSWLGLAACDSATPSATPDRITLAGSVASTAAVGDAVGSPLVEIVDATGRALRNVPFTVTVEGGGTLGAGSRRTGAGPTAVGLWTLGPTPGLQALTIASAGVSPLRVVVSVRAGAPSTAVATGPTEGLSAAPGALVTGVIGVQVRDAFGNTVPGEPVSVDVEGGGTVPAFTLITDAEGRASVGSWQLGPAVGVQAITLRVAELPPVRYVARAEPPFSIDLRYVGTPPSAAVRDAFAAAVARIGAVITADIPPWTLVNFDYASQCDLAGAPVLDGVIDDLVVYVAIRAIDGPGQTIGLGGPCIARPGSLLPIAGDVIFDSADLPVLIASGQLGDVILHELLHVVGLGTIWGPAPFGLDRVSGYGGSDPRFTGASARAAYVAAGGGPTEVGVPVEHLGGAGTRDAHWRESALGAELMTGILNAGVANPLSAITISALADLGYAVDLSIADAFQLGAALRATLHDGAPMAARPDTRALRFVALSTGGVRVVSESR